MNLGYWWTCQIKRDTTPLIAARWVRNGLNIHGSSYCISPEVDGSCLRSHDEFGIIYSIRATFSTGNVLQTNRCFSTLSVVWSSKRLKKHIKTKALTTNASKYTSKNDRSLSDLNISHLSLHTSSMDQIHTAPSAGKSARNSYLDVILIGSLLLDVDCYHYCCIMLYTWIYIYIYIYWYIYIVQYDTVYNII